MDSKARYSYADTPETRAAEMRSWIAQWVIIKKVWIEDGRDPNDFAGLIPPEGSSSDGSQESKSRSASGED